jgi:hypothetical protein
LLTFAVSKGSLATFLNLRHQLKLLRNEKLFTQKVFLQGKHVGHLYLGLRSCTCNLPAAIAVGFPKESHTIIDWVAFFMACCHSFPGFSYTNICLRTKGNLMDCKEVMTNRYPPTHSKLHQSNDGYNQANDSNEHTTPLIALGPKKRRPCINDNCSAN